MAYDERSILYLSKGLYQEALTDLNKALELEPKNSTYYFHRGAFYHLQKNIKSARLITIKHWN